MRKLFTTFFIISFLFPFCLKAQNYHVGPINYKIAIERNIYPPNNDLYDNLNLQSINGMPIGALYSPNHGNDGFKFYDTLLIFQSQMAPAFIQREVHLEGYNICYGCGYDGYQTYDEYTPYFQQLEDVTIPVNFPTQDTTVGSMRIKVLPSTEISYNLPTHDKLRLYLDNFSLTNISWEYSINGANNFYTIPVSTNNYFSDFSAYDIFGDSCVNYLGQTIYIRAKYSIDPYNFGYTFITPFTIRLSSPHITSMAPQNVGCYGEANGSFKVKFDRNLLPGEKLNIFLKNTDTQVDFSALNLVSSNFVPFVETTYTIIWGNPNYPYYYYIPITTTNYYQWSSELPEGNYEASLIGKYNNINTYTGSPQHFSSVYLSQPPIQGFQVYSTQNVSCKGGNNGTAQILARGGIGNYKYGIRHQNDSLFTWTNFTSLGMGYQFSHKIQNIDFLKAGVYYFKIRDANDCILRDSAGLEEIKAITITEPLQELKIDLLQVSPITAYDSTNGAIRVKIKGGTPIVGEPITVPVYPYVHQWRDSATNSIISNYSLDTTGGKYETRIANLAKGTYYFEANDASYNYDTTYNYQGCKIFLKVVLTKPDPLLINIIQFSPVRCNGNTDGILKAVATGGVPADSLGYNYKWFKFISGSYQQISGIDSFLNNVNIGQYKVEVKDKFNNVKLSNAFTVTEPNLLVANATTTQASCFSNADGTALGTVTGGTAPYHFQWSNSDLTPLMDSVPGGTYFLLVIDSLGCEATKQVTITSPVNMQGNLTITPIKCFNNANGNISIVPSGGIAPYQYTWSNSITGVNNIQNLSAGKYWVTTRDNNNCVRTDTVNMVNPTRYSVTAGPDRVVCPTQTIPLSASILVDSGAVVPSLTYQWIGPVGFTTSTLKTVNTLKPGTYYLTATNATGCAQKDTLNVTYNSTSAVPEFIVSTQTYVGENILLANLSNPIPDSVRWQVPANATIISQSKSFCELRFADTGRYNIAIFNYYPSGCVYTKNKNINVTTSNTFANLGNQANSFLKLFRVYPNPTSGAFTVELVFNGTTKARIRMVNTLTNFTVFDQLKEGQSSYTIPYNVSGITNTTYIIVIETAKGNFIYKLIKA